MTLQRRARLARKTRLARTPMKRRPRRVASQRKPTSGPTTATRALVWERAGGRCELCGRDLHALCAYSVHHRLPRKAGGTTRPWVNGPENLLLACGTGTTGCHGLIESQRASAYGYGWLIREGQQLPHEVSVVLGNPTWPTRTRLVWLTPDGTYSRKAPH